MPVPAAPVDRQRRALIREERPQIRQQRAVLIVDGTFAAEMIVVLSHFQQAFAGYVAAPQDVLEKGDDFLRPVWAAEGHQQYGVGHIQDYISDAIDG